MMDFLDSDGSVEESKKPEDTLSRRLVEGISTHAIFMLDPDGHIVTWPAPAETLYGHDAEAVVGRHVRVLFADEDNAAVESPPEDFFEKPRDDAVEFDHWHRRADESIFWGTLTLSPLWNDTFHGYAAVSRDTTSAKEYERMLER